MENSHFHPMFSFHFLIEDGSTHDDFTVESRSRNSFTDSGIPLVKLNTISCKRDDKITHKPTLAPFPYHVLQQHMFLNLRASATSLTQYLNVIQNIILQISF